MSRTSTILLLLLALAALAYYAWTSGYRVGKDIAETEARSR